MTPRPDDDKNAGQSRPPDEATGLPGFGSWAAVYRGVVGIFILWVVLLAVLSHAFR